ncbi:hypothetical protein FSO04_18740 [Paraburkholderia madseniana]|uniref:Uncharacterized protein n=1 Tax=Paraburkholderia madseniana TaxID=2599607 RepID=A0A6N6WEK8_9BURK|nr:hypothetical protein [Paraburkholderia madseniana]KAE8758429.1 hypothetical protein FSO04_18740 [Paraburkholderia madseniana]
MQRKIPIDFYDRQLHTSERQLIENKAYQMAVQEAHNPADVPTIEASWTNMLTLWGRRRIWTRGRHGSSTKQWRN